MPEFIRPAVDLLSFSRASAAYLSDGTEVASGQPRYEAGKFDSAIMVEEGTTNLVDAVTASFESGITGWGSDASTVLSHDATKYWHGTHSLKIVSNGTYQWAQATSPNIAVSGSTTYSAQAKVFGVASSKISFDIYDVTNAAFISTGVIYTTQLGDWVRLKLTFTTNPTTANIKIYIRPNYGYAVASEVYVDGIQVAQKAYVTSWQLPGSARSSESCTFDPAGIVSASEGSWAQWVYVDVVVKRQVAADFPRIFTLQRQGGLSGLTISHMDASANWRLYTSDDSGNLADALVSDSYTPDGWHRFVVTWTLSAATLYIDGALRATISNPKLPSVFLVANIGSGNAAYWSGTTHDDVRIWRRALSDSEIAADFASPNAFISGECSVLSFDSSLALDAGYGLSTPPLVSGYEHAAAIDPVIRSQAEAGYRQTRPRFTRAPKKWRIAYADITDADQAVLAALEEDTQYGADSMLWTHPKTLAQHTVRLAGPIRHRLGPTDTLWSAEMELEEV